MNEVIIQNLKKKGWTEKDIYQALSIIQDADTKKSKKIMFLDSMIYWIVLFVALIGNFVISIVLIPFMLAIEGLRLYALITVIAFAFGAFFDLLIRDIEKVEKKDIVIAGLFLPALAIINVSFMVKFTNYLQNMLLLGNIQHNPLIISMIYVIAFMLPYLIKDTLTYRSKFINTKSLNIR